MLLLLARCVSFLVGAVAARALGAPLTEDTTAAQRVRFEVSPKLGDFLLASEEKPFIKRAPVSVLGPPSPTRCVSDVLRPGTTEPARTDGTNRVTCTIGPAAGTPAAGTFLRLELDLGAAPIAAAGASFETLPFSFEGDIARHLYKLASDAQKAASDARLRVQRVCGQQNAVCLETYNVQWDSADGAPLAISCTREYENEFETWTRCVFHPRDEAAK